MRKPMTLLAATVVSFALAADLPDDYRAIPYVHNTGSAYVDTAFCLGPKSRVEMDFELDADASSANLPFGSVGSTEPHFFMYQASSRWYVQIGSSSLIAWPAGSPARTGRLTLVVDAAKGKAELGGFTVNVPYGLTTSAAESAYIFARHDSNGSAMLPTKMRLYSFKIYDDDVLKREYVPVMKRDTRECGLYETQEGRFLTHPELEYSGRLIEVASTNPECGEPVPACGLTEGYATGNTYVFYSPRRWIDVGGVDTATCTGWRFTRLDGTVEEGTGCKMELDFDAARDDGGLLEWVWTRNHLDELPEGYVTMPWLTGTGSQYVDTGLTLGSDMWVDMQCAIPYDVSSKGWVPFGAVSSDTAGFWFCYMEPGKKWSAYLGSASQLAVRNADSTTFAGRHRVQINRDRRLVVDGVASDATSASCNATGTAYVFARHDVSSGDNAEYHTPMDLYSLDVYGPQGPVGQFVPAMQTSDGALGLYDLLTQQFKPAVGTFGTATFIRIKTLSGRIAMQTVSALTGVNLSAPPAPCADGVHRVCTGWRFTRPDGSVQTGAGDSLNMPFSEDVDNGGLLEWTYREAGEPELPDGYVRLDCVSSDGSGQYVDTGIVPDSRTSIRARFKNYPKSGYVIPFGLAISDKKCCFLYLDNTANVSWSFYWQDKRYPWTAGLPDSYGQHEVLFNFYDGLIALDGYYQKDNLVVDDFAADDTLYLFARHESSGPTCPAAMDLHSFTISTNGVLAREFVPAHSIAARVAGLYETVEGRFYPNAGTGVFEPTGGFVEVGGERVFGRVVGETYTYEAPVAPVGQTTVARRRCVGWRFTRRNGTTSEGAGRCATLTFTADDDAGRLEWIWSEVSRGDAFRRCELTFAADAVAGTCPLTNFPALVRLSAARLDGFDYGQCAPDGSDVRFSLSPTGADTLASEIDVWNPAGESLIWVKIPALVRGLKFYMFWGDGKTQQRPAAEVWDDYIGVWHFNVLQNGAFASSTPTGPALVSREEGTLAVDSETACVGSAKSGSSPLYLEDYQREISAAREDRRSNVFSISGWFRVSRQMLKDVGYEYYYPYSAIIKNQDGWFVESQGLQEFTYSVYGNGSRRSTKSNMPDLSGGWAHIAISAEEGHACVAVNGVRVPGYSFRASLAATEEMPLCLPYGWLDEVRLSRQVLSEDWMRSEYRQVVDPSFLTAGAAVFFEKKEPQGMSLLIR